MKSDCKDEPKRDGFHMDIDVGLRESLHPKQTHESLHRSSYDIKREGFHITSSSSYGFSTPTVVEHYTSSASVYPITSSTKDFCTSPKLYTINSNEQQSETYETTSQNERLRKRDHPMKAYEGSSIRNSPCNSSSPPLTPPETPQNVLHITKASELYDFSVHILYNAITWARNIPTFVDLPFEDQSSLLANGWSELFLLSLAQWKVPLELDLLIQIGYGISPHEKTDLAKHALTDMVHLQTVVSKFRMLDLDPTEFACAKAVTLFKPGKVRWYSAVEVSQ